MAPCRTGLSDPSAPGPLSPHLLNPVGRLWAFLVSVETRGEEDAAAGCAVSDYLGLEPASPALGSALAAVLRMPGLARTALAAAEPPGFPRPSVEAALDEADGAIAVLGRPEAPLRLVRRHVGPPTMATLKGTSAWLIGAGGARVLSGAALEALRRRALDVAAAVDRAPAGPLGIVRDRARGVLDAVRLLPLTGPDGIEAEASSLADLLGTRPDIRAAIAAGPGVEGAVRELTEALAAFATAS